ncbi:MAG: type II secretion system F family protein [Patescibacteria group bacterium]
MIFSYKALDERGTPTNGTIDTQNKELAINSLQRRGYTILAVEDAAKSGNILTRNNLSLFGGIKTKDVVILSKQMSTLFTAQVSALRIFQLLAQEMEKPALQKVLLEVADDIQSGSPISTALSKHPKVFDVFYTNMVKAGEESGKLDETFLFLADYMERNYEVSAKVKNALIYPAFVITTFVAVMVLMLTVVIPKISTIITDSGQDVPIYTKAVIGVSNFLVNFGPVFIVVIVIFGFIAVKYLFSPRGKNFLSRLKLELPYVSNLYKKLYLSRIADNLNTMLTSGIPMLKALELTSNVIDNVIYEGMMLEVIEDVKSGFALSDALGKHPEMPGILVAMTRVGEETGEVGSILKTLARFYQREVMSAVDTLVDLIEPLMIVMLGLGVGFLLASVLIPIYNISSNI